MKLIGGMIGGTFLGQCVINDIFLFPLCECHASCITQAHAFRKGRLQPTFNTKQALLISLNHVEVRNVTKSQLGA